MGKPLSLLFPGVILLLTFVQLPAQTSDKPSSANAAAAPRATPSSAAPAAQAPDDATKKLSELVHAGKYTEAQQLTSGLLVAYPDDQRLIKAKALIEKMLSTAGQAAPGGSQPVQSAAANTNAVQLTGIDKLEYNTLLELARQAQQQSDPQQQKASLTQFMGRSNVFLQKHPDEMLVWQLRAASAISLNDSMAGYEAGQQLIAAGAADSTDQNLQRLLAQLNSKGGLDKQKAEDDRKYGGILGTWRMSWSLGPAPDQNGSDEKEVFVKSASGDIEGYYISEGSKPNPRPNMRGVIKASGAISWEMYLRTVSPKNGESLDPEYPGGHYFVVNDAPGKRVYPSAWQPPTSYVMSDDKKTMTMKWSQQTPNPRRDSGYISAHPVTWTFEKLSD